MTREGVKNLLLSLVSSGVSSLPTELHPPVPTPGWASVHGKGDKFFAGAGPAPYSKKYG